MSLDPNTTAERMSLRDCSHTTEAALTKTGDFVRRCRANAGERVSLFCLWLLMIATVSAPAALPLIEGQGIVTCAPGDVFAIQRPSATDPVLGVEDFRNLPATGQPPIAPSAYAHSDWQFGTYTSGGKTDKLGGVFGLAYDSDKNIYVSHSNYGVFYDGTASLTFPWQTDKMLPTGVFRPGKGGPGAVYKVNANTGAVTVLAVLPNSLSIPIFDETAASGVSNSITVDGHTAPIYYSTTATLSGPGLGNITFDSVHSQLFVTNMEDGKIYRLSLTGSILDSFDPLTTDNGAPGYAPLGERLWGIAYNRAENRVYYSVWKQDFGTTTENELRSVGLNTAGALAAGTDRKEFDIPQPPGYTGQNGGDGTAHGASPVSDIEFSEDGQTMLLAGKEMLWLWAERGHRGVSMSFTKSGATWSSGQQYWVGGYQSKTNAAGGIAFGYGDFDSGSSSVNPASKEQVVWVSGNAIQLPGWSDPANIFVYGAMGFPSSYTPASKPTRTNLFNNTWNFDFSGDYLLNNKGFIGDIDIYQTPPAPPCAITDITMTGGAGTCDDNGTPLVTTDDWFLSAVTVTFSDAPATGNLVLSGAALHSSNTVTTVAVGSTTSSTSHTFVGVKLKANNTANALTATFDADSACTLTENTAAVPPCSACPTITVTPNPLSSGTVGTAYTGSPSAGGGTAPFTWTATSLPAGLSISPSTGAITGNPTATGTATITATDANGCTGTTSLTINPFACPTITVTPAILPEASVGQPYSETPTASGAGGGASYGWSATSLPAGLSINPTTGLISGTPTAEGTATITATYTGPGGELCTGTATLSIVNNCCPQLIFAVP